MRPFALLLLAALGVAPVHAQDPTRVDPAHYRIEFENERVRVLRIHYGPGEKSMMHAHPAALAVFLTDANAHFTAPDGKTRDMAAKAGTVAWEEAGMHLPQNAGDQPFELILVEMKEPPADH